MDKPEMRKLTSETCGGKNTMSTRRERMKQAFHDDADQRHGGFAESEAYVLTDIPRGHIPDP
jgi:hypothetical protein